MYINIKEINKDGYLIQKDIHKLKDVYTFNCVL